MNNVYREVPFSGRPSYEFHTGEDYFDALSSDIDAQQTGGVSISTLGFDPSDLRVLKVTEALRSAANRGLDTSLTVDNFSVLDKTKLGLLGNAFDTRRDALGGLRRSGVKTGYSNYPSIGSFYPMIPSGVYSGRSHIKSAVVGDKLYLGGISLDATDRLDAMVAFKNPLLAMNVAFLNQMAAVSSVKRVLANKDHVFSFDKEMDAKLLVDAGVRGRSVIFNEALSIVDEAEEEVIYASEQFPNGKIGKHLLRAFERGVDVKIAVNHPNSHDRYRFAHKAILDWAKRKYPAEFFANQLSEDAPTLHTKAIASESRAMVGSHNLNTIGVNLGTAELDVVSSDPDFIEGTRDLVLGQIKDNAADLST